MNKFEVGDKVKCIKGDNNLLREGKEYTIKTLKMGCSQPSVTLEGVGKAEEDWWFEWRFKLVDHAQDMAKQLAELAKPREVPDIRCNCCGIKAPKRVVKDHYSPGNVLGGGPQLANHPDLTGWLVCEYPYKDPYMNHTEGSYIHTPMPEKVKACPQCAPKVMATVKHLATPYVEGCDE